MNPSERSNSSVRSPRRVLFHDLAAWDFADNGDFLTLDKTTKHAFLFRRIDRSGQVVTERAIEGFSSGKMVIDDFAKISDDAWFVAVRDGAADTTLIRRLDVRSGTVASLEQAVHLEQNGVAPRVAALTALRDSGFAALLAYHYQYTISECLGVFDEAGRSRFVIPERTRTRPPCSRRWTWRSPRTAISSSSRASATN